MDRIELKSYDEVYNRVVCDPGIALEIADYFTFDVPGAKFMPMYKNKMWDGKVRIFNAMSSLLYCGLTEQLEAFCKSRDYELDTSDLENDVEFSIKEAEDFIKKLAPKHNPRDYQLDAFVHSVRKKRQLLLSPTASGKSLIIYLLTCFYASKTLIIVPTISLVHQMTSDFEDYGYPKDAIHKIMSGQEKDSSRMVYISTWQSIYKMSKSWFNQFNVVIGDEAHNFKSKSLIKIMSNMTDVKYKFGFTGTLDGTQTNKLILEGLFGPVRRVTTTSKLIEQKHLADFKIKVIVLSYPDQVKQLNAKNDYKAEIDLIVGSEARNRFIKNLVLSLGGNTILLFQYVEKHGKVLYDMIQKEAIDRPVHFISGDVDGDSREEIRKIVEEQENAIMVASYGTSSTGLNIRNLHNVVFASPSKSRIRNLQSIGRGLRKSSTKTESVLYDIADDLSWKSKKNYTLLHMIERIKTYNEEQFPYKIYKVDLN